MLTEPPSQVAVGLAPRRSKTCIRHLVPQRPTASPRRSPEDPGPPDRRPGARPGHASGTSSPRASSRGDRRRGVRRGDRSGRRERHTRSHSAGKMIWLTEGEGQAGVDEIGVGRLDRFQTCLNSPEARSRSLPVPGPVEGRWRTGRWRSPTVRRRAWRVSPYRRHTPRSTAVLVAPFGQVDRADATEEWAGRPPSQLGVVGGPVGVGRVRRRSRACSECLCHPPGKHLSEARLPWASASAARRARGAARCREECAVVPRACTALARQARDRAAR